MKERPLPAMEIRNIALRSPVLVQLNQQALLDVTHHLRTMRSASHCANESEV